MAKSYLNVPYAEKDAAKALGAKWDAGKKKWYAPNEVDLLLFEKWNIESITSSTTTKLKSISTAKKPLSGTVTYAKDKSFVAYSGVFPPWE